MSKEEVESPNIISSFLMYVVSIKKNKSTWTRVALNHNQMPLVSMNISALK